MNRQSIEDYLLQFRINDLKIIAREFNKPFQSKNKQNIINSLLSFDQIGGDRESDHICIYIENSENISDLIKHINGITNKTIMIFTSDYTKISNWVKNYFDRSSNIVNVYNLETGPGTTTSRKIYNKLINSIVTAKNNVKEKSAKLHQTEDTLLKCLNNLKNCAEENNCKLLPNNLYKFANTYNNELFDEPERHSDEFKKAQLFCNLYDKSSDSSEPGRSYNYNNIINKLNLLIEKVKKDSQQITDESLSETKQILLDYEHMREKIILDSIHVFKHDNNIPGCEETIIYIPNKSPELTTRSISQENEKYIIPKIIHYIWIGGLIPKERLETFLQTSSEAIKNGYEVVLWTDSDTKLIDSIDQSDFTDEIINKTYKTYAPKIVNKNINILDDSDIEMKSMAYKKLENIIKDNEQFDFINEREIQTFSPIVTVFDNDIEKINKSFDTMKSGVKKLYYDNKQQNLALYADYLRLLILYNFGGIYLDMDVTPSYNEIPPAIKKLKFVYSNAPFMATGNMDNLALSNNIIASTMKNPDMRDIIIDSLVRMALFSIMDIGEYNQVTIAPTIIYSKKRNGTFQNLSFMDAARDKIRGQTKVISGPTKRKMPAIKRATLDMFGPSIASILANKYTYGILPSLGYSGELIRQTKQLLMITEIPGKMGVRIENPSVPQTEHWSRKLLSHSKYS